ncbi:MAG: hypothetical protein H7A32_01425 [Deltaproteobacteria bacterium]|nr:hypothetical protein [Deltaproteobacteria bacterium]
MNFSKSSQIIILFIAYLLTTTALYYFGQGIDLLLPLYLLLIIWVIPFVLLSFIFQRFIHPEKKFVSILIGAIFSLMQGAIGFALAYFLFNLNFLTALSFSLGALLSFFGWIISLSSQKEGGWGFLLLAALIATGIALALRFGGIFGALAFTLAWLNSMLLGLKLEAHSQQLWLRANQAVVLLAIARATIQYYLQQSNYDSLGVVISHPYSFAALFAGIFIPIAYSQIEKQKLMPSFLTLFLLGILIPSLLGVFIHVRPVAGYLLGLSVSIFTVSLLLHTSFKIFILGYFNLITATSALPLFRDYGNLTRETRLVMLAALAILLAIIFSLNSFFNKNSTNQIAPTQN